MRCCASERRFYNVGKCKNFLHLKNYYRILLKAVSEIGLDKPIMIEKDIFEASPDAEFYELTDENIDHFFGE